jgi:peptidoglycan-N-acetylglucosamine deacetylase
MQPPAKQAPDPDTPQSEIPNPESAIRRLPLFWRLLEGYFARKYRIRALDDDPTTLLAFNLYRHTGADVPLKTGEVIRKGDLLMELHFRREAMMPLIAEGDPLRVALEMRRMGERELPRLARMLESDAELREVAGVHALTLFYRGINKMGFEIVPLREKWAEAWFTWWHRLLMARDSSQGSERVRRYRDKLVTRHIWMSRAELIRRYGESPSPDEAAAPP